MIWYHHPCVLCDLAIPDQLLHSFFHCCSPSDSIGIFSSAVQKITFYPRFAIKYLASVPTGLLRVICEHVWRRTCLTLSIPDFTNNWHLGFREELLPGAVLVTNTAWGFGVPLAGAHQQRCSSDSAGPGGSLGTSCSAGRASYGSSSTRESAAAFQLTRKDFVPNLFFHFSCFPVPARARSEQPAAARCHCAERVAQLCRVRGALGTKEASRWPPFASCPSALGQFYPLTWDLVIGREAGEIQEPRVWFVGSRWSVC